MPKKVECPMVACFWNDRSGDKCGNCIHEEGIALKWRMAFDLGKGSMVLMECLNFTLPDGEIMV
jgi:hypothetical protein